MKKNKAILVLICILLFVGCIEPFISKPKVVGTIETITQTYNITASQGFVGYDIEHGAVFATITLRRKDGSTLVIKNVTSYNLSYEK